MKKNSYKKALKPSQRESITEYSSRFGMLKGNEGKMLGKRIAIITAIVVSVLALIYIGYFLTEMIIGITELPVAIQFFPEETRAWILSLSIHG